MTTFCNLQRVVAGQFARWRPNLGVSRAEVAEIAWDILHSARTMRDEEYGEDCEPVGATIEREMRRGLRVDSAVTACLGRIGAENNRFLLQLYAPKGSRAMTLDEWADHFHARWPSEINSPSDVLDAITQHQIHYRAKTPLYEYYGIAWRQMVDDCIEHGFKYCALGRVLLRAGVRERVPF